MRVHFFLGLSLSFLIVFSIKVGAQPDYRSYYIDTFTLLQGKTGKEAIRELKRIQEKYESLLPFDLYRLGLYYDQEDYKDSARFYLELAISKGMPVYNKMVLKRYQLCDLLDDEPCSFVMEHKDKILKIELLLELDQSARNKDYLDPCGLSYMDSIFSLHVFRDSLLSFSNVGYLHQQKSWLLAMHVGLDFNIDSSYIIGYLTNLVKDGELSPYYCASILDKYYFVNYGYQVYGTVVQHSRAQDTVVFKAPFMDLTGVNRLRKQIGLVTLEEWWNAQNKYLGKMESVLED